MWPNVNAYVSTYPSDEKFKLKCIKTLGINTIYQLDIVVMKWLSLLYSHAALGAGA